MLKAVFPECLKSALFCLSFLKRKKELKAGVECEKLWTDALEQRSKIYIPGKYKNFETVFVTPQGLANTFFFADRQKRKRHMPGNAYVLS